MFEEIDPDVMPLDRLLRSIEVCLYDGNCMKCPYWEDVKTANTTRDDCRWELLYQAEQHLKGK